MCLKLKEGNTRLIVADKDIVCYKVLLMFPDGTYVSMYQRASYELNKLMVDNVKLDKHKSNSYNGFTQVVGAGCFHTFKNLEDAKKIMNETKNEGVYYTNKFTPIVVRCIIPKGARYYSGSFNFLFCTEEYESYASKKLMVTDEVTR